MLVLCPSVLTSLADNPERILCALLSRCNARKKTTCVCLDNPHTSGCSELCCHRCFPTTYQPDLQKTRTVSLRFITQAVYTAVSSLSANLTLFYVHGYEVVIKIKRREVRKSEETAILLQGSSLPSVSSVASC